MRVCVELVIFVPAVGSVMMIVTPPLSAFITVAWRVENRPFWMK
jgi:hypothetical protein